MSRDGNLFYHIIKDENSLTELFCNLLKYNAFRLILRSLLCEAVGKSIPEFTLLDVFSQVRNDNGQERPDIVIRAEDCFIIIENKIRNLDMTRAQKAGYKETFCAAAERNRYLVFLIPESYSRTIGIDNLTHDLIKHKVVVAKLYWGDLIEAISDSTLPRKNIIFTEFLILLRKWFISKTVEMKKEGVVMLNNKEAGDSYFRILELIEGVAGNLSGTQQLRQEHNEEGYGYAVIDAHGQSVWFGIDYDFWKQTGYVLCIAIDKKRNFSGESVSILNRSSYENPQWSIFGVPLKLYASKGNTKLLKDIIIEISQKVSKVPQRIRPLRKTIMD